MTTKTILLITGPLLSIVLGLGLHTVGVSDAISLTLAITFLTAFWWITEALPIPATSLIPFVFFPLSGVMTYKDAAAGFGHHVILLLMGGFMIAKGLEKSYLHNRLAIGILERLGSGSGFKLILAFMLSGALLSMWISNLSTCLVLMPIAMAALQQLNQPRLMTPVVLCIAYSCNLGGIATLVGTPANLVFAGIYEQVAGTEYSFLNWTKIALPVTLIGLPITAVWLSRGLGALDVPKMRATGVWAPAEKRVLGVFALIVFLWVFRLEPFGGWSSLMPFASVSDSTVALFGVLLMFVIPSGAEKGDYLLDWETASDVPWGMLLLFAGGLTIAKAFQISGASEMIGQSLTSVMSLPPFVLILCICLTVSFLTEITSNTATTTLLVPILAAAAISAELPIELLMIPATISASCAFMLPAATAPNAIAFGTGHASIKTMAREGLVLNLILSLVTSLVCYFSLA